MPQTILKTSPKNRNPHPQKTTHNPDLKTAQLCGKTAALRTLLSKFMIFDTLNIITLTAVQV